MPVMVLGLFQARSLTRFVRSAMLDVVRLDYITTARAKGLGRARVVVSHVMRNALIPVVTLIALQMPAVFGGAMVTEQIFRIPGIGSLLISSILSNDTPVVMAVTFVFACLVVLFNLIADVLYGWLDPRIPIAERRRTAVRQPARRGARPGGASGAPAGDDQRGRAADPGRGVVFGPLVWRISINEIDFTASLQGPSLAHPFGTDDLGQDILARMIYGGRISLAVGLAAMLVACRRRRPDRRARRHVARRASDMALMWLTDLFLSLPHCRCCCC